MLNSNPPKNLFFLRRTRNVGVFFIEFLSYFNFIIVQEVSRNDIKGTKRRKKFVFILEPRSRTDSNYTHAHKFSVFQTSQPKKKNESFVFLVLTTNNIFVKIRSARFTYA